MASGFLRMRAECSIPENRIALQAGDDFAISHKIIPLMFSLTAAKIALLTSVC